MFEAGVPPASVLRGETIGDERVFDNNNFAGPENESPFSINQLLNPLIFIRVVKVLEVMTFSNRGHFDTTAHSVGTCRPESMRLASQ
jgi:hypothetical protein